MDFLDLFPFAPPHFPGEPSRRGSRAENVTAAVGTLVFPAAEFMLVLFADLWMHPVIALFAMPAFFTAASFMVGRSLQVATRWTLTVCLGCAVTCFVAGGIAFLMGVFASFYSGF